MTDGEVLKYYIDNQSNSKIKIAKELEISKQTLYQYFRSKTLAPETKRKLEDHFGKEIFTGNTIINMQKEKAAAVANLINKNKVNSTDYRDDYIQSLKEQIHLLKEKNEKLEGQLSINLNEIQSNQKVLMTMLTVAMSHAAEFFSHGDEEKARSLKRKMMRDIASGHEKIS